MKDKKKDWDIFIITIITIIMVIISVTIILEQLNKPIEKELDSKKNLTNNTLIYIEKMYKMYNMTLCSSGCYAVIKLTANNKELLDRWKNDSFLLAQGYTTDCSCLALEVNKQ